MNTLIIHEQPKLVRVVSHQRPNGKIQYRGVFSDVTQRKLRESTRTYGEVVQLGKATVPQAWQGHDVHYGELFVFGLTQAKPDKWQARRVIARVQVEDLAK